MQSWRRSGRRRFWGRVNCRDKCEGGGLSEKGFRNLNRRGLWPLVSVEKDSHAQPPLAAMAVFPLLPRPLLPKSSWRLAGLLLHSWFRLTRNRAQPSGANCLKEETTRTPAALRERGVWGERGFSQRSRLSPQNLPTVVFPAGSAREGAFLQKGPLPRIFLSFFTSSTRSARLRLPWR